MPFGKLVDFEYINQIDRKILGAIIFIISLAFVIGILSGIFAFSSKSSPAEVKKCDIEKRYHVIPKLVNWFQALETCHKLKMKLISIESEEEQTMIMKAIKDAGLDTVDFWTSGTRAKNDGVFMWSETGNNFTYTNWAPGEPNKQAFMNPEECMNLMSGSHMKWNDVPCHFDHNIVCELQF